MENLGIALEAREKRASWLVWGFLYANDGLAILVSFKYFSSSSFGLGLFSILKRLCPVFLTSLFSVVGVSNCFFSNEGLFFPTGDWGDPDGFYFWGFGTLWPFTSAFDSPFFFFYDWGNGKEVNFSTFVSTIFRMIS